MPEDSAFFRFDTNADRVASDIAGAMERINASLSRPASSNQLSTDTQNFASGFRRMEEDVQASVGRLKTAITALQSGQITPREFATRYEELGRGAAAGLRTSLSNELGLMPQVFASRLPVREIGVALQEGLNNAFRTAVQGVNLGGIQLPSLIDEVGKSISTPANFGFAGQARIQELNNQLRAEKLVRDAIRSKTLATAQFERQVKQAGLDNTVHSILENPNMVRYGPRGGVYWQGSDTAAELRALNAQRKEAVGLAEADARAMQQEALKAYDLAHAMNAAKTGYKDVDGVRVLNNGMRLQPTSTGFVPLQSPFKDEKVTGTLKSWEEQALNLNRLMANWGSVVPVGQYRVLGNEVFQLSKYGAERVTHEARVKEALEGQARALDKQMMMERQQGARQGLLGGFMSRFTRGDSGVLSGLGTQMASAAAFTLAYSSIFALTGVMHELLGQFLDYQDSVTDLEVATRSADTVTSDWINSLSELSRLSGSNMGQAMDTAARGVRAFTDAMSSADEVRNAGSATVSAATQLAVIANKSMTDTTGDLVASGSAFGLQPDQLNQVVDAVANAKRNVGGDAAQISQGLSLLALSAQEAGYNLNEAAAVMGLVQARTDQSGQAIATRLTRIFQITQGSTGKNLAQELGIDPNSSVKDQLASYAKIYSDPNTTEDVKDRISSSLGGTANLRELLPLLKEGATLNRAFKDAETNAGQGAAEFQRKLANLVGTFKLIKGDLSNIAVGLARSGLFDFVAGAAIALEPALYGVDQLLKNFNGLIETVPGLRQVVGVLVDLALVTKGIGILTAKRAALTGAEASAAGAGAGAAGAGAAGEARGGAEARENAIITEAGAARLAAETSITEGLVVAGEARLAAESLEAQAVAGSAEARVTAETVAADMRVMSETAYSDVIALMASKRAASENAENEVILASTERRAAAEGAGTMRAGGGALLAGIRANPWGLIAATVAIGGLIGYGKLKENQQVYNDSASTSANSLAAFSRLDGSSASLYAAAHDFKSVAGQLDHTDVAFYLQDRQDQLTQDSEDRAKSLTILARRVQKEEELAAATQRMTVFGDGAIQTTKQLADGMEALTRAGGTALTGWNALAKALTREPPKTGPKWRPASMQQDIITGIMEATGQVADVYGDNLTWVEDPSKATYVPPATGDPRFTVPGPPVEKNFETAKSHLADFTPETTKAMIDAVRTEADRLHLTRNTEITPEIQAALYRAAIRVVPNFDHLGDQAQEFTDKVIANTVQRSHGIDKPDEFLSTGIPNIDKTGKLFFGMRPKKDKFFERYGLPSQFMNGSSISRDSLVQMLTPNQDTGWQGLESYMRAAQQAVPEDNPRALVGVLKGQMEFLKGRIKAAAKNGKPVAAAELLLRNLEHEFRQSLVDRLDDLRLAQEARATSTKELRAIRRKFVLKEVKKSRGDASILEPLFESLDRQTISFVIDTLRTARETAKQAVATARHIVQEAQALLANNPLAGTAGIYGAYRSSGLDKAQKKLDRLNETLKGADKALQHSTVTDKNVEYDGGDSGSSKDSKTPEERAADAQQARQDHADLIAAQAQARAARLGGGLASARAAIVGARAQINAAQKGTTEYFQALAQLYEAQWQFKQALEAYHASQYALKGDMTDPVEQARDALRSAREKYMHARSKDDKAAAQVEVRQSEYALEQARWDQKLSDMQTAEQLGRIKTETYVRYLQRESERMHKMDHKTRQQIDHMNQIDLALKDAMGSMEGQFNLGDIDMRGFVYQTRRWAAQQKMDHGHTRYDNVGSSVTNTNNNVTINGTDVHMVRKVLREMLGDNQQRRTASNRRA